MRSAIHQGQRGESSPLRDLVGAVFLHGWAPMREEMAKERDDAGGMSVKTRPSAGADTDSRPSGDNRRSGAFMGD